MNRDTAITLAITGASGAPYALRLLEQLIAAGRTVFVLISDAARPVIKLECRLDLPPTPSKVTALLTQRYNAETGQLTVVENNDWFSAVASGSGSPRTMIVCPCSMGTLSSIACGLSQNLMQRAAAVVLKERHQLIMVPREAPYNEIHLEQMLKLTRMGAVLLPASPGFYHQPQSINDLVDFVVARVLDQLNIPHTLMTPWG